MTDPMQFEVGAAFERSENTLQYIFRRDQERR